MATQSFYESLIIDTEEKAQILLKAFEDADNRPPEPPLVPSAAELIENGNRLVREGYFDNLIREYKNDAEQRS